LTLPPVFCVAQVCNLLYRRFAIGSAPKLAPTLSSLHFADCKSAIQPTASRRYGGSVELRPMD